MVEILLAVLFVIVVYLVATWVLAKFKIDIDDTIVKVLCLILLILILIGRVSLPF